MSAEPSREPLPAPQLRGDLPPLRIHHLLVWMAVMAAMLALPDWTKPSDPNAPLWAATIGIVQNILASAALTCLIYGALWWRRGRRFPSEPGHALLILSGVTAILGLMQTVLISMFYAQPDEFSLAYQGLDGPIPYWAAWLIRWSGVFSAGLLFPLCIAFCIWCVHVWRWRIVFVLIVIMIATGAAIQAFFFVVMQHVSRSNIQETILWINLSTDAVPTAVLFLCLILAAMGDWRLAISRHWSHWVGVGVYAVGTAFELIRYLVWYLILGGT